MQIFLLIKYYNTHLTARKACTHSSMNQRNGAASILPPITRTISSVSLMSGSKPRLPPGELSNMKPKSMCMIWPWVSIMILPLWRSFICRRYVITLYAAIDLTKLRRTFWNSLVVSSPCCVMKYWYMSLSVVRPSWSLDVACGTHSITPHW